MKRFCIVALLVSACAATAQAGTITLDTDMSHRVYNRYIKKQGRAPLLEFRGAESSLSGTQALIWRIQLKPGHSRWRLSLPQKMSGIRLIRVGDELVDKSPVFVSGRLCLKGHLLSTGKGELLLSRC